MEGSGEYTVRIVGLVEVCETIRKKWPGQMQFKVTKFELLTDQRPTAHPTRIVNRPPRTRLFESFSIKELALDGKFKVVNALVIHHRWLWGLEIPLGSPFGVFGRFRRLSGEKQRKGGGGGHVQGPWRHSR